jgi:O-antigen/teichoic acid export membrane protein
MNTESQQTKLEWWQYWPIAVGVATSQVGASLLGHWMSIHLAAGVAGFIGWSLVPLIWLSRLRRRYGIPRWAIPVVMGLAMGAMMAMFSYLPK